jgi:hypothetical protein
MTNTTATETDHTSASRPARTRRWVRMTLVGGAVTAAAFTGIVAVAAGDDVEPTEEPAVVGADRYAAQLAELARVAREQGLAGLSPVSLRPISTQHVDAERYAAQLAELAQIAREQRLTGLSPVSLRPIDD